MNELLDRRWLTNNGPFVQEFEQRIAELNGVKHCVATCNATAALEVAIRALDLRGEVIVPAFTFIATAHALRWHGLTPVFCDIDPRTHNIDPSDVLRHVTPRTTGILGVHLWGRPCNVDALTDIARARGLVLLFDAAHAFQCSHKGRMVGQFGDAEVFSFHATKCVSSGEGGAIVTNDDELARRARLMINFGFEGFDRVTSIGINAKMSEVAAAMGLTSLESLHDFVGAAHRNYNTYECELADVPGIRMLAHDRNERSNYHYIVLEIDEAVAQIGRDDVQRVLWAENVLARRYFYPGCHRQEPYASDEGVRQQRLPVTDAVAARVLCLPNGTAVGPEEVAAICRVIRFVAAKASEVQARLRDA
jgi:dTDP-4-amino-4,6-dideoxygalactose transaminase